MDESQDARLEQQPAADEPAGRATATTGGRLLLVYATRHGSTREVADAVAAELRARFAIVDVLDAGEAPGPTGYDAVVVGGPMIMGWHRAVAKYVKTHRDALAPIPTAFFITAASLTDTGEHDVQGVPVVKDTWLAKPPASQGKLRRKERYALPAHYLGDILKECAPLRPRTVAFFAGSLDLTTMNIFEKLFVLLVIGATPGDGRHWEAIREWAAGLGEALAP
jgi:menaquinone-dependent protoporphyrinogen IX oxidase